MPPTESTHSPWAKVDVSSSFNVVRPVFGRSSATETKMLLLTVGTDQLAPREETVSEPTREEFDAKLMATEERLNGRLIAIDGKLDRLFDRIEVAVQSSERASNYAEDARKAAADTKWNILFTALGVVGVLFAAWALWAQGIEMMSALLGIEIGGQ